MRTLQHSEGPCISLGVAPLDRPAAEVVATAFKALADPVRVQIVSRVAASPSGEVCACELLEALALAQPTVSHHLKLLTQAGILHREQRGKWAFFSMAPGGLVALRSLLEVSA